MLNVILRVMMRLNQQEHLFRLLYIETICQSITFLTFACLQNVVALFYTYRSNLHGTTLVSIFSIAIATTLDLNNCSNHRTPVNMRRFLCSPTTGYRR